MPNLSSFKKCERDAEVIHTHYVYSPINNSVTFALDMRNIKQSNANPNISAIITTRELVDFVADDKGVLVSDSPKRSFFEIHNYLLDVGVNSIDVNHYIDKTAKVASSVKIYGNVHIGANVVIEDNVILHSNSVILDDVYIAAGAVIGARGMHNTKVDGQFIRVVDVGGVIIGKGCEILSNAVIQKSYFAESTQIGDYSIVSVGVNIGHGSKVGKRTLVAGNAQLAGYCNIGDDVWIGPSTVIAHGIKIGDNANIMIGSAVIKNVKPGKQVSGNFAYDHTRRIRNFAKDQRI